MVIKKKIPDYIVIPRVEKIAREMTTNSQIMIILKKLINLGPLKIVKIGFNNLIKLPTLAKKDFAAGVNLLTELELNMLSHQTHWVLHPQMTDMAVALRNTRVLSGYFRLAKNYNFQPGIATNNLQHLLLVLADFGGVPKDLVIYTPFKRLSNGLQNYVTGSPLLFADWKRG